jgi:hypothetical protein
VKQSTPVYLKILALAGLSLFVGFILILLRNKGYFFPLFTYDYLVGDVVQKTLDMPYEEYATGSAAANFVAFMRWACLGIMGLCSIICLLLLVGIRPPQPRLMKAVLFGGGIAVVLMQAVQVADNRNYMLIAEYAIVMAAPFLLWYMFNNSKAVLHTTSLQVVILLTFCAHGLFAIGYPLKTPASFVDMIIHTTGVKEATARQMLLLAGVLDFAVSLCLFAVPTGSRFKQICLAYLAAWGLLTALGRILGNYYPDLGWYNLRQFIPETLYRLPHFFIPLLLLVLNVQPQRKTQKEPKVVKLRPTVAA